MSWRDEPGWPAVDVVMPVRDEAEHLADAVASIRAQDYPGPLRIHLGVGPSTDDTLAVARRLAADGNDLVVVDNPSGLTPAGLNAAIGAGAAPVIARVDGHSELSDGYLRRAVETMRRTGAVNVGGRQQPIATTPFERAVAAATTSWLGTGGASYRVGASEGTVDTVYLGVFDRAALEAVGGFDDRLVRNQDYELNIRLRAAGGEIVFDPALSVGYRPRASWAALARQYFEYGRWKVVVMRMHPGATRLRQIVPPVAISIALGGLVLSGRDRRAVIAPLGYLAAVAVATMPAARSITAGLRTAAVAITIHVSWVAGIASSIVRPPAHGRRRGRA